jgi:ribosomal protein S18 acetylase RimI-like enzyme
LKIRKIKYSDIDQVRILLTNSFSPRYNKPFLRKGFSDSKNITLVAETEGSVVAVASLYVIEKLTRKMGLIEDVAVDPKLRGKGIGKKLIKNLIKYSVKENCDKVSLSSSEKNVPFYEKIGFQVNELQMILRNN